MYDNIVYTLLGAMLGWVISHLYAEHSSKELNLQFENVVGYLQRIEDRIRPVQPQLADEISKALKTHTFTFAEPGVFGEIDPCTHCGQPALKFTNWGNGPLGQSNAWYQCSNCNYRSQTQESSND